MSGVAQHIVAPEREQRSESRLTGLVNATALIECYRLRTRSIDNEDGGTRSGPCPVWRAIVIGDVPTCSRGQVPCKFRPHVQ